uniref:BHLH domain-containing protein n=1 Tax=Sinocyclocheilus rhinocerous TaxID=307959 RepID=A0A673G3I7_9TELE
MEIWEKPMVEKMCRDRINSSIEQLKCLLAPEFLKQPPDSKLEEADILEMTLCTSYEALPEAAAEQEGKCPARPEDLQQRHECQQERHLEALVEP